MCSVLKLVITCIATLLLPCVSSLALAAPTDAVESRALVLDAAARAQAIDALGRKTTGQSRLSRHARFRAGPLRGQGANWEHTGVAPDVKVPAPDAHW
jgi:hypothetical protein